MNNIRKNVKFFTRRGSLTVKKLPAVETKVEKLKKKKNLKDWTEWNKKMGGRSYYIPSGAFGDTLLGERQGPWLTHSLTQSLTQSLSHSVSKKMQEQEQYTAISRFRQCMQLVTMADP